MTNLQKGFYSLLGLASTASATFAGSTGTDKFGNNLINTQTGTGDTLTVTVQNLIEKALLIIGLVAVVYGIYGGVQMMTAGGDEEKVKKGRTIIIQVLIGIVVIFLANSIVRWFLFTVMGSGNGNGI